MKNKTTRNEDIVILDGMPTQPFHDGNHQIANSNIFPIAGEQHLHHAYSATWLFPDYLS